MFWRLLCENFCEKVWGVMLPIDCFAILLVITQWWDTCSFVHLVGGSGSFTFSQRIHVVSTGSHPKIPPMFLSDQTTKTIDWSNKNIVGILWWDPVLPTPPTPPKKFHFFPIFSWFFPDFSGFLGFPLLNQRIIRDFGGVPGGGIFSLIFPWI